MRVTFSEDGRDFLARDWSDLVTADPSGTFFHTPAYLKLYWEEFGDDVDLLLAFVEDGGVQVGVAVFERMGSKIRFLGGTEVTDYAGPLAAAGSEGLVAKELVEALAGLEGWAEADLRGQAEDSAWIDRLRFAFAAHGLSVEVTGDKESVAPYLPLPVATWDEYLAGLPSKLRHEIKRKARKLEAELGEVRIVEATRESLRPDLDRFVALHRSSEGPKGKFLQPGMEIFFRRLGEAFLDDHVFHLTFLEAGGEKIAGTIGFLFGGRYYLYNSAFDHEKRHLSPGMVLVGETIRQAIEHGCDGFDMLKGDFDYKYRFGAKRREVKRLVVTR